MRKRYYILILTLILLFLFIWSSSTPAFQYQPNKDYLHLMTTFLCTSLLVFVGAVIYLYYIWGSIILSLLKGVFVRPSEEDKIRKKYAEMLQEE